MKLLRRILLSIDEVDNPPLCLESAMSLARHQKAEISLISVLPSFDDLFAFVDQSADHKRLQQDLEKQTLQSLEHLADSVEEEGVVSSVILKKGSKTKELVASVIKSGYDILIKDANPDSHIESLMLGAVDRKLIRHCPCPIWIIRQSEVSKTASIVVGIDAAADEPLEKELNRRLIHFGMMLADYYGCPLEFIYAWDFDQGGILKGRMENVDYFECYHEAKAIAEKRVVDLIKKTWSEAPEENIHLVKGTPSHCIIDYCRNHDVNTLVIGSVGRTGLSGILIGNTAERIIDQVACSILVVSPKEIKSPLEISLAEMFRLENLRAVDLQE